MSNNSPALAGMEAALYLRKSRAEDGMETDDVLARHRAALVSYAKREDIHIAETYPEVVSGESLYARPQMLRLLEDVEEGRYDCILCMDLDRLSRGRMRDQGLILDTLKDADTLIVTPDKVYNLSDEMDEEYAELKTFIARREYKIITKRLQRGLQQSIRDGCYVANAPYGYHKVTVDRRPTLEIYEPEAYYVRMMFDLYLAGHGCTSIARTINELGGKPHRSEEFSRGSVAKILTNPTYMGKIVWNQKTHIRKGAKGNPKHVTIYNPREKWSITDGLHPAIVSREVFDRAQEIYTSRHTPGYQDGTIHSPLMGLVRCANCGRNMQMQGSNKGVPYLLCVRRNCCAGAQLVFVEDRILDYLREVLERAKMSRQLHLVTEDITVLQAAIAATRRELAAAQRQKTRLYELLELGEYDIPTFRTRMDAVKAKISKLEKTEQDTQRRLDDAEAHDVTILIGKIEALLASYPESDPAQRNALLRTVIDRIDYHKAKKTKPSDFRLDIHLLKST